MVTVYVLGYGLWLGFRVRVMFRVWVWDRVQVGLGPWFCLGLRLRVRFHDSVHCQVCVRVPVRVWVRIRCGVPVRN